MENNFSFESRVLACTNCGAPITTGLTGGQTNCEYCGTSNMIVARAKPSVGTASVPPPASEEERLNLLRQQDGKVAETPAALKPLLQNNAIPDWKMEEAITLWNRLRAKLEKDDDYQTAEEFFYLTFLITNHDSFEHEPLRIRALYESALEVFTLPRHRQSMYCLLARNAAREGNPDGAESWLEPCTDKSTDLMTDSDYRVTRAYLDIFRRDYQSTVNLLGSAHGHVPIFSTLDGLSIIIRAAALEKTGQVDAATNELFLILSSLGKDGKSMVERVIRGMEKGGEKLCEQSFAKALARAGQVQLQRATRVAGMGGIGKPFAIIGTLMLIAVSVILAVVLFGETSPRETKGMLTAVPTLGIIGIVFSIIGYKALGGQRKIRRLHEEGVTCQANVVSAAPTGWKINNVPQYKLILTITPATGEPYQTELKLLGSYPQPGAQIEVKVDPQNPRTVLYQP